MASEGVVSNLPDQLIELCGVTGIAGVASLANWPLRSSEGVLMCNGR